MLITTLVVSFLVCCMLEVRCGLARVVSGLQAKARVVLYLLCFLRKTALRNGLLEVSVIQRLFI